MVGYVGISRPLGAKQRGWAAQHRKAKLWKSGFASSSEAASWLAAQLKVRKASLLRHGGGSTTTKSSRVPGLPMSRYHGVVVRVRRCGFLYEARVPGQRPRTFVDEEKAAKLVARHRSVPLDKLRKREPFTRAMAKKVWRRTFRVFKRYQPADMLHLLKLETESQPWFKQEPTLRLLCVMLKFGPWREALLASWRGVSESSGVPAAARNHKQRACMLLQALKGMCKQMDNHDDELWRTSIGRNVSHVNGPLATLNTFRVVFRCSGGRRSLRLGLQHKRLCRGFLEHTSARGRLTRWVASADDCVVQPPRTCEAWVLEHGKLDGHFQQYRIYAPGSYNRNFLICGLLLAAMKSESITALRGAADISVQAFAQAFPDQRSWMIRLARRTSMRLQDLFDDLGYHGRPECFSMYTCLLLTRGMRKSEHWYKKYGRRLTKVMLDQGRTAGVMRLPLACVNDVQ